MINKPLIIIFARNPEKGKVKTRLAADVGDDQALEVYEKLLQYTKSVTSPLPNDKLVAYSDYINVDDLWNGYYKVAQVGNDLGIRLHNAVKIGLDSDYKGVIIIGTDCADLTTEHLQQAIHALEGSEVVIGPAKDGGYYLIGMNKLHSELFRNKSWSTDTLLKETIASATKSNLEYVMLEELNDIDTKEDLDSSNLSV